MKKILFIILAALPILLFIGCSSNNGEEELSEEAKASKIQNELYNKVLSNIVGHWKGYQYYNTSVYRPTGWQDISHINWTQEYIFNSDGTCKDIRFSDLIIEGTYSIVKNENYIKYPATKCELFLITTLSGRGSYKYMLWMDGEYLRLDLSVRDNDWKPANSSGGAASIRYKKE